MKFDASQPAYQELRSRLAERTDTIVAWVGAGISVPAALPTWTQLRTYVCDYFGRELSTLSPRNREREKALARARIEADLWTAFEILRSIQKTTFVAAIREAFRSAETATIPAAYLDLWKLRLGGMLNLNLDQLASRAFSSSFPGKHVEILLGRTAADFAHVLRSPAQFIVNLHGIITQENSWVFARSDLKTLLQNEGYKHFIRTVLTTKTVLFVGLTAEDVAVGGHLLALRDAGLDFGQHFWITDRRDSDTDRAAERLSLRPIRYCSSDNDHSPLGQIITDLRSFVPREDTAPPVLPSNATTNGNLPIPTELAREDPAIIRRKLNAYAATALAPRTMAAYEQYEEFCRKYDRAIYQAWYVSTDAPDNDLMGYKLLRQIGSGAFGEVYEAQATDGRNVAVKILHERVRKSPGMLQSFRRGVRSMRILSERGVQGMVPYREAYEIPAFAVMDLIQGPNLADAVKAGQIDEWRTILKIATRLATIVRTAHLLPERVLHRDLRPQNIMLRGFYGKGGWSVVVLDFDLSWHRDAFEESLVQGSMVTGYLAPEQVQRNSQFSTRNAAVDSYGFGMTLYFMVTRKEPLVAEHRQKRWQELLDGVRHRTCEEWRSLPARVARLIDNSTKERQAERLDMAQIQDEIFRLAEVLRHPDRVKSAELIAEEVVALTQYGHVYAWNADKFEAQVTLDTGVTVLLQGREADAKLRLKLSWLSRSRSAKNVGKFLKPAGDRAIGILRKGGWNDVHADVGPQQLTIDAGFSSEKASGQLDKVAASLNSVVSALSLG